MLAWLSVAVPTARADGAAPPPPPTDVVTPVDGGPAPDPAPDPAPPTDPTPPPPPSDPTPPTDQQNPPDTPSPPADKTPSDSWTTPDRSDSSSPQSAGATSGTGADATSGTVLATPDIHPSSGKGKDSVAIAPGVDDFDSFSGVDSGGTSLLPDDAQACATVACTSAPRGFAVSVAVSVERLRETAARARDASRIEGLARAMPPSPPGGLPGRAYSMPGSAGGGGGGGAPLLFSVIAVLATALALDWAKSFRLPTATWRLSAYVPPIEHPG